MGITVREKSKGGVLNGMFDQQKETGPMVY